MTRSRSDAGGTPGRVGPVEWLFACLSAALVFGVYVATIYPGLLGIGDATKFTFVAKILGTPHPPGYPLYVMVSHLFSYVPIGSLAYRMNLFSALLGAVAVGVGYLIARQLEVGRASAVAAALALGFGASFWATALYAKTYTLSAALVSIGILLLLMWRERRRTRDLYAAIAVFTLCLGNHLLVIALIPALVLFVLVTDARTAFHPRTILATIGLTLLGLSQYFYVLVRTLQEAPYLEARASTLTELWNVVTVRRWAHEIGAFSFSSLIETRVPAIGGLIGAEFGWFGALLTVAGLLTLGAHRPRVALLFGVGALGVISLTTNMSSEEDRGFLLLAFVLLWPLAAVGLDRIAQGLRRVPSNVGGVMALTLVVLVPASQIVRNYEANDHHEETQEDDYFKTLFAALPPKAAFVDDEYRINMMVLYKIHTGEAIEGRQVRMAIRNRDLIDRLRRDGVEVFAFEQGRQALTDLGYRFVPFPLPTPPEGGVRRDVFRTVATPVCVDLGGRAWTDVRPALAPKGRITVRVDNRARFDARLTLYVGAAHALSPALAGASGRGGPPSITIDVLPRVGAGAERRLSERLALDGVPPSPELLAAPVVTRAEIVVNDEGDFATFGVDVGPGAVAAIVSAHADTPDPKRVVACSHPLADIDALPAGLAHAALAVDAESALFGDGWFPVERRTDGFTFRWSGDRAWLVTAIDRPGPLRIELNADVLPDRTRTAPPVVTLVVNGRRLDAQPVPAGRMVLAWDAPADAVRQGLNELVIEVEGARRPSDVVPGSTDTRLLGVSVTTVTLSAGDRVPAP